MFEIFDIKLINSKDPSYFKDKLIIRNTFDSISQESTVKHNKQGFDHENKESFDLYFTNTNYYLIEHPFEYWFELKNYLDNFFNSPKQEYISVYIKVLELLKFDVYTRYYPTGLYINFYIVNYKNKNSSAQRFHHLLNLNVTDSAKEFYYNVYKKLTMVKL